MSTMLSKEVRTYWKEKVSSKFSDRTNDIETENHNKITAISNAKYPAFEKSLGLAKLIKAFKVAEVDLQTFKDSKERVERNKENKLTEVRNEFIKELERWKRTRKWEADIPSEKEDNVQTFMSYLEGVCFDEAKKHFYNSKEGNKMQVIRLQRERAMDILHSDGPKEELLKALARVCEVVKIPMSVPTEALKISAK
jgi:transcription initiation factor TFIIIB Brf1 subunit/transcription initiation factor TFIIB